MVLFHRLWEYFYDPDYGNCYTFTAKTKDNKKLQARKVDFWQEANGETFLSIFIQMAKACISIYVHVRFKCIHKYNNIYISGVP